MQMSRSHPRDHAAESNTNDPTGKVVRFLNAHSRAATHEGEAALDLVHRAAEMIRGVEDRAAALEVRAQGLVKDAAERMQLAERRSLAIDAERQAAEARTNQALTRMQEVEKALEQA